MKVFNFLFFIFSFLISFQPVLAGTASEVHYQENEKPRRFDQNKLNDLKKKKEYNYHLTEAVNEEAGSNFFEDLFNKIFRFSTRDEANIIWQVVSILIAIAFISFIVFKLVNADKSWFLSSDVTKKVSDWNNDLENIEDVNFRKLIEEAINNKEYKIAIRLFYLNTLQELHLHKLISWTVYKTNNDYLSEISSPVIKEKFSQTALIYEYIWYGNFHITEEIFQSARSTFEDCRSKIDKE